MDIPFGLQGEVFARDELRALAGDDAALACAMRQVHQRTAGFEQAAAFGMAVSDGGAYAGYAVSGGSPRERGIRPTKNRPP
ncbi:hypothetical protein LQD23_02435 [Chromobacterium violaceum]|nr:hypothetical protein [Chromobacterium violaceum]MCD0491155.1 hypothetical protein [Chromobacterium violaceum]